jgi:hypothetical protein
VKYSCASWICCCHSTDSRNNSSGLLRLFCYRQNCLSPSTAIQRKTIAKRKTMMRTRTQTCLAIRTSAAATSSRQPPP